MYPKVRPDLYVTAVEGGVRVMIDGQSHTLKGPSVLPLLERLLPFLNGERSLAALCAGLAAPQAQAVNTLITALHGLGVVRDHAANQGVQLSATTRAQYAHALAYLETQGEAAERRFSTLRERSVGIVGHGSAVRTLAPALWESGVRQGFVFADAESLLVLRASLDQQEQRDPSMSWGLGPLPLETWAEPERARLGTADLVIAIGAPEGVGTLFAEVVSAAQAVLPVQLGEHYDLIGPLSRPGQPVCLQCAQARLPRMSPGTDTAVHAMAGARAAIETFKHLAGLPSLAAGAVIRIDGHELTDTLHPVMPDGRCQSCEPLPPPSYTESIPGLIDPLTGLIRQLDAHDLMQLPVCLWVAHTPDGTGHVGVGRTAAAARTRAALNALRAETSCPGDPFPALGRTREEWLGLSVLELARQQTTPDEPLGREQLADLFDREAALWWKTLQVRDGRRFTAWLGRHTLTGVPVVELRSDEGVHELAAGRTVAEALKTALLSAVARAQLAAEPDLAHLRLAPFTGVFSLPEPTPDVPGWPAFLTGLGAVHVQGLPLAASALWSAGLFAGPVAIGFLQSPRVQGDAAYS